MNFENRIKKEMTEGIIKAILEDAGYRVIDSGIEKLIRELSCLSQVEYQNLGYPDAMKCLPDFTVMDREQKKKSLVEVRYRNKWGKELLLEIQDKVKIFKELVLISINANPPSSEKKDLPSEFLRCCELRYVDDKYQVELSTRDMRDFSARNFYWKNIDEVPDNPRLWWEMAPLQDKFADLKKRKMDGTLYSAVQALAGILNKDLGKADRPTTKLQSTIATRSANPNRK
jgi:hypothetical protein